MAVLRAFEICAVSDRIARLENELDEVCYLKRRVCDLGENS